MTAEKKKYVSTQNPCKLCAPLGACLAFKGLEKTIPLLHGSQGCSTYVRRYIISHFREPVDIASSNFTEESAIYGGAKNLMEAMDNIIRQYSPEIIGVATTCLSETIGDDVSLTLHEYRSSRENLPLIVSVSTPSYSGTHIDGYWSVVYSTVKQAAEKSEENSSVNIFPNMISPEDIRHLREIGHYFGTEFNIIPDYSVTLDGGIWSEYQKIPEGGTKISDIKRSGSALGSIEFSSVLDEAKSPSKYLENEFSVPCRRTAIPVGIEENDKFFTALSELTGKKVPEKFTMERMRLVDSYADGHKYIFGARAAIYGEEDFVYSVSKFLLEIGVEPVLCASGGKSGKLAEIISGIENFDTEKSMIIDGSDFIDIEEQLAAMDPDLIIGNSKGYPIARKLGVPLLRAGFPIHDRFGGQRMLHTGYKGTQNLYDMIVNTILDNRQAKSPVGYFYM